MHEDDDDDGRTPSPVPSPKAQREAAIRKQRTHHHGEHRSHHRNHAGGGGGGRAEAAPGEREWEGSVHKAGSSEIKCTSTHIYGASIKGLVPASLKVCGRMKHEDLRKFLQQLDNSRSRSKSVLRLDLTEGASSSRFAAFRYSIHPALCLGQP